MSLRPVVPLRASQRASRALALACILALCALWVGSAAAEEEVSPEEYRRVGTYVGLAAVIGGEDFDTSAGGKGTGLSFDEAGGLSFVAGFRGGDLAAIEVEVEWLDSFESDDPPSPGGKDVSIQTVSLVLNAKGHVPVGLWTESDWGRIDPYFAYGIGAFWAMSDLGARDKTQTALVLQGGGGVDVYLTRNVAVGVEVMYVAPFQGAKDLRYVSGSLGVKYRF